MTEKTSKPLPYLVPTLAQYCAYHAWLVQKNYEKRVPALIAEHEEQQLSKGDAK